MKTKLSRLFIQQCIRKLTELPTDKMWFAITVGFVVGAMFWLYELHGNKQDMINLTQLMMRLGALVCIFILATMGFKRWMGTRWSNQHWFERTLTFISNSCYGIVLSAITYDIIFIIFFRR